MKKITTIMRIDNIIQTIVAAICVAMLVWMLQGCKTPQPIVQTEVKEIVTERVVKDTIITIAPDSASIKALLECDSAGNVLIRELEETQGKNVSLQAQLKNTKQGTTIVVECNQDSLERVIQLQNEKISELSNNKQTETIEIRYIPKFYKIMAWTGVGLIVLLIGWFALKIYKAFFLKV